jgi:hypothetical protein
MRRAKRALLTARSRGRPAASNSPESAVRRPVTGRPVERLAHTSSYASETSTSMAMANRGKAASMRTSTSRPRYDEHARAIVGRGARTWWRADGCGAADEWWRTRHGRTETRGAAGGRRRQGLWAGGAWCRERAGLRAHTRRACDDADADDGKKGGRKKNYKKMLTGESTVQVKSDFHLYYNLNLLQANPTCKINDSQHISYRFNGSD